jgi:hypothetical protein
LLALYGKLIWLENCGIAGIRVNTQWQEQGQYYQIVELLPSIANFIFIGIDLGMLWQCSFNCRYLLASHFPCKDNSKVQLKSGYRSIKRAHDSSTEKCGQRGNSPSLISIFG